MGLNEPLAVSAGINVWTSHGPKGGNINALAIDPQTPTTLYAGTSGSGVAHTMCACSDRRQRVKQALRAM